MRRLCGDCHGYALFSSGSIGSDVESDLKAFWRYVSGAVVEGAGCVIADWQGVPLSIQSNGCVVAAATSEMHK